MRSLCRTHNPFSVRIPRNEPKALSHFAGGRGTRFQDGVHICSTCCAVQRNLNAITLHCFNKSQTDMFWLGIRQFGQLLRRLTVRLCRMLLGVVPTCLGVNLGSRYLSQGIYACSTSNGLASWNMFRDRLPLTMLFVVSMSQIFLGGEISIQCRLE